MISLTVISGRSGSGKSTALNVLEDLGYYVIDNLPVNLLGPLLDSVADNESARNLAVSIDARNIIEHIADFPGAMAGFDKDRVSTRVVFLDADSAALLKRFSETRRRHPLTNDTRDLNEALSYEQQLLQPISDLADLAIDTTSLTMHELRDLVKDRVSLQPHQFALMFQSFAYKNGVPPDADIVFDVRCLPNPHWLPNLRALTGRDDAVQAFLDDEDDFREMQDDVRTYLERWLPRFKANNRSYMTIAIGCTGGQHRSVYLTEQLYAHFSDSYSNTQIRHRELGPRQP